MTLCRTPEQVGEVFRTALLGDDLATIAALYEEDASFYDIDGPQLVHRGRVAIRAAWASTLRQYEFVDYTVQAHAIRHAGDLAFTQMLVTIAVRPRGTSGQPTLMAARATEVLHRGIDDGWRYLIDHASAPQPAAP